MKKIIILVTLIANLSLMAYTNISSENYILNVFVSNEIKNLTKNSFNYTDDIAVVSLKVSKYEREYKSKAYNDGREGFKKYIKSYSNDLLKELLEESLVSGPGYDSLQMSKIADEVTENLLKNLTFSEKYNVEEFTTKNNEFFVMYKIDKETVKRETIKLYIERLDLVIGNLKNYRENVAEKY